MKNPEEIELEIKKNKLSELEEALANNELDLITIQKELQDFQKVYLCIVGRKIAELDELEAKINEVQTRKFPHDEMLKERASEFRTRANESSYAYQFEYLHGVADQVSISPTIKKTYRNLAKKIHPDLAVNEEDRSFREEFMKRANEAYKEGDEEKLLDILQEWESSPEQIEGDGIGAELIRTIRKIDNISKRIENIKREFSELFSSDLYILEQKVDKARSENRDLLQEMVKELDIRIKKANLELKNLLST